MSKRIVLVSLVLASLVAATPHGQRQGPGSPVNPVGPADVVTVQLLAINDFHGNLEPPSGTAGRIGDTPAAPSTWPRTSRMQPRKTGTPSSWPLAI
jgi:2',3'-cyclic-nucleotide 2'-phosphodiesterase (5'-nucleotidase family)